MKAYRNSQFLEPHKNNSQVWEWKREIETLMHDGTAVLNKK
jgi:hypothetical protein